MSQRKKELENFIQEALKVRSLRDHEGWQVLRHDIETTLKSADKAWPFLDPKSERYSELRIKVLACRMILQMVEDYEVNRLQAEREWLKTQFPELYVEADVDNETLLKEEEGE